MTLKEYSNKQVMISRIERCIFYFFDEDKSIYFFT